MNLRQERYGSRGLWVKAREFLIFLRNVALNTWMIALYYVIDDTEVTKQADINRKELALELSIFCF